MRRGLPGSKPAGILLSVLAYVAAGTVAVAAARSFPSAGPLLVVAVGCAAATTTVFAASLIVGNSSMFDPYWSVAPAAIAGYYMWLEWPEPAPRQLLVTALVLLYAVRLTANFYRDWPGLAKEDFRYVGFRHRFPRAYWVVSYLGIHLFPASMVYVGCLPLYAVARSGALPLGPFDAAGAVVMLAAVVVAFAADGQLRRFRREPGHAGKCIDDGLWRFSRHPNYLGEIATWWGLYLFALASGSAWWWTGIGAAAITVMFVFISVPMMERRALATREGYREYRARTPMLLPSLWPSRAGSRPGDSTL